METKRITDIGITEDIYQIRMQRDFDPNELKPWSLIEKLWNRNEYAFYALTESEAILGYALFARKENNYLLDYLAIEENHRDRGLGSLFLKMLAEQLQDTACIVVEVEDPGKAGSPEDRALRERRLKFYLRNGYRKTGVVARVYGVDYLILEVPADAEHTAEEIFEIYTDLYRSMHPAWFFQTQFRAEIIS